MQHCCRYCRLYFNSLAMLILTAIALIAVAYWAFVTKPVKDEKKKEINLKNRQAAADAAIEQALRDDYSDLYNQNEN